eukprot:TRINITY_DN6716_c0_g1_i2.p1 TRINITY_DN6716_c0_g1~~TRINITY_DN6716_c0_g1_i2.p1  ORF type:complete len:478 (+),score=94.91 TRINITY_DN6716_c0_g1_i2:3-1436(+)
MAFVAFPNPNPVWACGACTFANESGSSCAVCGTRRDLTDGTDMVEQTLVEEAWMCPQCTFLNGGRGTHCEVCGGMRPIPSPSPRERLASSPSPSRMARADTEPFSTPGERSRMLLPPVPPATQRGTLVTSDDSSMEGSAHATSVGSLQRSALSAWRGLDRQRNTAADRQRNTAASTIQSAWRRWQEDQVQQPGWLEFEATATEAVTRLGWKAECPPGSSETMCGAVFVAEVLRGGWADQQGVREGDELVEVSGVTTEWMTWSALTESMRVRPLRLLFRRDLAGVEIADDDEDLGLRSPGDVEAINQARGRQMRDTAETSVTLDPVSPLGHNSSDEDTEEEEETDVSSPARWMARRRAVGESSSDEGSGRSIEEAEEEQEVVLEGEEEISDHEAMAMLRASVFPVHVVTAEQVDGGGDSECVICIEEYVLGDSVLTLPCFHRFHEGCVRKWLCKSNECPSCKFPVDEASFDASVSMDS